MNKSAARAADILTQIAETDRPLGISEISRRLGIPKSSTSDCLYTLAEKGFLAVTDDGFILGHAALRIGLAAQSRFTPKKLAKTVFDGILTGIKTTPPGFTLFLAEADSDVPTVTVSASPDAPLYAGGDRLPWHLSAAGKALLARCTDADVCSRLGMGCYFSHTSRSIHTWDQLKRELAGIRERGWAIEDGENSIRILAAAIALTDTVAIGAACLRKEADPEALIAPVRKAAEALSPHI